MSWIDKMCRQQSEVWGGCGINNRYITHQRRTPGTHCTRIHNATSLLLQRHKCHQFFSHPQWFWVKNICRPNLLGEQDSQMLGAHCLHLNPPTPQMPPIFFGSDNFWHFAENLALKSGISLPSHLTAVGTIVRLQRNL